MSSLALAIIALLLTLGESTPAAGWRPDRYGDPLPPGAVARLGSTRLRQAGLSDWAFPVGSKVVLTIGNDHVVRSWDLTSGREVRVVRLAGGSGPYGHAGAALSPDGQWAATASGGGVEVWSTATGKRVRIFPLPEPVDFVRFAPDGARVVTGLWDGSAHVLDRVTGRAVRLLPKDDKRAHSLTAHGWVARDGERVAAGGGRYAVLDVTDASGKLLHRLPRVSGSAVSPDGKWMAACGGTPDGAEAEVWVLDLATGKDITRFPATAGGSFDWVAWSPDGKTLACGGDNNGCLLDVATGRILRRLTGPARGVSFSPDGKILAAAAGPKLCLWDVTSGAERHPSPGGFGVELPPPLGVSHDGGLLAAVDETANAVAVWDTRTGGVVARLPVSAWVGNVRGLSFQTNGRVVVAVTADGYVRSWSSAGGPEAVVAEMPHAGDQNWVSPLYPRMSADGHRVVLPGSDWVGDETVAQVYAWDTSTGRRLTRPRPPVDCSPTVLGLSADGSVAVLERVRAEGLAVVDVDAGRVRAVLPGQPVHLDHAAVSADGRLVAAWKESKSGWDGRLGVWEAATGKVVAVLPATTTRRVAFAAGGRVLVTADEDALRAWDLATGAVRVRRPYPLLGVNRGWQLHDMAVSGDGRRAVTLLTDGTAVVWDLTPAWPVRATAEMDELTEWWADLASDAARAYKAMWRLEDIGSAVVPFLRGHLRPVPDADSQVVHRLVADLDSPVFSVREAAARTLAGLGSGAAGGIRTALGDTRSAEVRVRLEGLLAKLSQRPPTRDQVRFARAITVLEHVGTADARKLLTELAGGAEGAVETREAKAALDRLVRGR